MNAKEKEDALTLEILQSIEGNEQMTQRHLADNLGVALGLANSYLKRCANKGLIKIKQVPANRYFYYLTPKGFAEKSRLTAEYLSSSFDFYRKASGSINESLSLCQAKNYSRIVFCGASELAEITSVRIHEYELEHIATFDREITASVYLGKEVWSSLESQKDFDVCLITAFNQTESVYREVNNKVSKENIFVPSILGLNI